MRRIFVITTLMFALVAVATQAQIPAQFRDVRPTEFEVIPRDEALANVGADMFRLDYRGGIQSAVQSESSSLPPGGGYEYGVQSATDGTLETGWAEGEGGSGIGESITVFVPKSNEGNHLYIFPGWGSSASLWAANNRVASALVTVFAIEEVCCDGSKRLSSFAEQFVVRFDDEPVYQGFPIGHYIYPDFFDGHFVNIQILSVHSGSRWDDTVIAEVRIADGSREPAPSFGME